MPDFIECSCAVCAKQCNFRPGYFKPEEIDKVAKYLNMDVETVFYSFLAVDWDDREEHNGEVIFIIAPALKDSHTGVEYPEYPSGECSFYMNKTCTIYPVRPFECRLFDHRLSQDYYREKRLEVVQSWKGKTEMIEKLLGRPPQAKTLHLQDIVNHWW